MMKKLITCFVFFLSTLGWAEGHFIRCEVKAEVINVYDLARLGGDAMFSSQESDDFEQIVELKILEVTNASTLGGCIKVGSKHTLSILKDQIGIYKKGQILNLEYINVGGSTDSRISWQLQVGAEEKVPPSVVGTYSGKASEYVTLGESPSALPCEVTIKINKAQNGYKQLFVAIEVGGKKYVHTVPFSVLQVRMTELVESNGYGRVSDQVTTNSILNPLETRTRQLNLTFNNWDLEQVSIRHRKSEVLVKDERGIRCDQLKKK